MGILSGKKVNEIVFSTGKSFERKGLTKKLNIHEKGLFTQGTRTITVGGDGEFEKTMPLPERMDYGLLFDVYDRVPIVANAVNNTADFAIQNGFELEGSESDVAAAAKFNDEINFDIWGTNILKLMQVKGNAFIERATMRILPTDGMRVIVSTNPENNGEVIGYKQLVPVGDPIRFDKEEIIHFKWNEVETSFYGRSDITPILGDLTRWLNYQEDIGEVLHRYGNPIIHWQLGGEETPASAGDISSFKSLLDSRQTGEDLITSGMVSSNVISSDLRIIQPDGLLKQLENSIIAGMRVPAIFIKGGQNSNRATAQVELQAFDRKVRALRRIFSEIMSDEVYSNLDGVTSTVKISWNELSLQDDEMKSEVVERLVKSGMPITTSLKIAGWRTWVNDFEKDREKEEPIEPVEPEKAPVPQTEPKEEDYRNQADFIESYNLWKKRYKA